LLIPSPPYPDAIQDTFKQAMYLNETNPRVIYADNRYCDDDHVVHKTHKDDVLVLHRNGSISVSSIQVTFDPDMYCVDIFHDDMHKLELAALICLGGREDAAIPRCPEILRVDISDGVVVGENVTKYGVTFTEADYYRENGTLLGCVCNKLKCLRKCCARDEIVVNRQCEENYAQEEFNRLLNSSNFDTRTHHLVLSNGTFCAPGYSNIKLTEFEVLEDGRVFVDDMVLAADEYCIDTFTRDGSEPEVAVVLCVVEDDESPLDEGLPCLGRL
ncbi:hypothetical protein NQ318_022630, partial [Aromia moschata]